MLAKYALYNYGESILPNKSIKILANVKPIASNVDTVVGFYKKIQYNYFVTKDDWKLNEQQVIYLKSYLRDLEKFKQREGHSNAPDFYVVMKGQESFVVLDTFG